DDAVPVAVLARRAAGGVVRPIAQAVVVGVGSGGGGLLGPAGVGGGQRPIAIEVLEAVVLAVAVAVYRQRVGRGARVGVERRAGAHRHARHGPGHAPLHAVVDEVVVGVAPGGAR